MNILIRRALRSIKSNIKSYLAISIISLLSVMLYTGLHANYKSLKENVYGTINDSNLADIYVTTKACRDSVYDDLLELDGVERVEKRLYVDAYVKERKLYLTSYDELSEMNIPASYISRMSNDTKGVYITESFAERRHINIGDFVDVTLKANASDVLHISPELKALFDASIRSSGRDVFTLSEFTISVKITGIIKHAESLGNLANDVGMIYAHESFVRQAIVDFLDLNYDFSYLPSIQRILIASKLSSLSFENQYLIKGGSQRKVREYFESFYNDFYLVTTKDRMPGTYAAVMDVKESRSLCFVFPVIFYISALLIIVASIDKSISDDHMALALQNALGEPRGRIYTYYSIINVANVLLGGIIGLILGPIIIPKVLSIKYVKMYSYVKHSGIYTFDISYLLIFIVLITVSILITLLKCFLYLRRMPKDVMANINDKPKKRSVIERILPKRAFTFKMALRNIFWNPLKSLLVIIGVGGCTALLACSFGIKDTLDYGLDNELNNKLNYDIEVSYDHKLITSSDIMARDSRITSVEEYAYSIVTIKNSDTMLDSAMYVIKSDSKGINVPLSSDGVTLSKKLASELRVGEGDTIGVYTSGRVYNVKIAYVTSMFFSQGIFIPREYAPMPYENNRCIVECEDGSSLKEVADAIDKEGVYFARTKEARYKSANSQISAIRQITILISVFAVLLGISVVYNLVSMNYSERIRDMASLKSLGYGYSKSVRALMYEIVSLTLVGSIIGAFAAKPFLKATLGLNEPPLISFVYRINSISYIISILITLGLSVILNLIISIKIKDIDMVSNIKGRE